MNRRRRSSSLVDFFQSRLWPYPVAVTIAAAGLGLVLTSGSADDGGWRYGFGYRGSVSSANSLLIGELGALVTAITIAFSMVLGALQTAVSEFSPRLARRWVDDVSTKVTLSTFFGSIVYVLLVLYGISGETGDAPSVAITVSMVAVVASAISAVAYFHHVAQSLRIENVLSEVVARSDRFLDQMAETADPAGDQETPRRVDGSTSTHVIRARRSGYLRAVDPGGDAGVLDDLDLDVHLMRVTGDWIAAGEPLAEVHTTSDRPDEWLDDVATAIDERLELHSDRSTDGEVDLFIRLLVDVAVRAISPAVNDPYTAVQAVHRLRSLLLRLVELPVERTTVEIGRCAIHVPQRSFDQRVELACSQITRFANESPTVLEAQLDLLSSLALHRREHSSDTAMATFDLAPRVELIDQVASSLPVRQDRERLADLLGRFPDIDRASLRVL